MKKTVRILLLAAVVVAGALFSGCAGAYVGVSVPVGYPYGGWGPYGGGYGGSVGVAVPIGRPTHY